MGQLAEAGYEIRNAEEADTVVWNTCGIYRIGKAGIRRRNPRSRWKSGGAASQPLSRAAWPSGTATI